MKQTAGRGQLAHDRMPLNADHNPITDCGDALCQARQGRQGRQDKQDGQDREERQDSLFCALAQLSSPQRRAACSGKIPLLATNGAWPRGLRHCWQAGAASALLLDAARSPFGASRLAQATEVPVQEVLAQDVLAQNILAPKASMTARPCTQPQEALPSGTALAGRPRRAAGALGLGLALLLALPFAGGCSARQEAPAIDEAAAFVDRRLMDAGDAIARDLALLAGSRSLAGSPAAPALGSPLAEPLSLHWDGPLEGALTQVCALAGLKLAIAGRPPDMAPQVHVRTAQRPCRDILEDLSRQAGPCARLSVDAQTRLVRLWYLEPPETLRGQARAKPVLQSKPGRPAPSGARPQSAIP